MPARKATTHKVMNDWAYFVKHHWNTFGSTPIEATKNPSMRQAYQDWMSSGARRTGKGMTIR